MIRGIVEYSVFLMFPNLLYPEVVVVGSVTFRALAKFCRAVCSHAVKVEFIPCNCVTSAVLLP
jgi:hypothetical protein